MSLYYLQLGPLDWYLFEYAGNIIAINLVGALLPFILSVAASIWLLAKSNRMKDSTGLAYLAFVVAIGIVTVLIFFVSNSLLGGISMPGYAFFLLAAAVVLVYCSSLEKGRKVFL